MTEKITSKDNSLIKHIAKLMSSAKYRHENACFVCEGIRLCMDAVFSGAQIICFCFTEKAFEKNRENAGLICSAAKRCVELSVPLFSKLSSTDTPQGFLCIVRSEEKSFKAEKGSCYAALERIQDPSNLGTILRTAEALGADGVILSSDCCDVYSPKVVRGSMGAVFRLPVCIVEDLTQTVWELGKKGIRTFASTPRNAVNINETDFSDGGVMLIGNEGNGLDDSTIDACTDRVMIPMKGRAESLNASAAASILLYKLICG